MLRERSCQPFLGTRKLHHLLNKQTSLSFHVGRDRLFKILKEHRLLVQPKRAYHKTTNSHHRFRCHPNLLKPSEHQVVPGGPGHVWVADITYLPVRQGEAYLSLVTDAYSRKIVGYHVHDNLKASSVVCAYQAALRSKTGKTGLIHHSDRGSQYCSELYQKMHEKHGVICSMTDGYDCYQNAIAERVNGILKTEYLPARSDNIEQARKLVDEAVKTYNTKRPHLALKYKTPDEVHRAFLT